MNTSKYLKYLSCTILLLPTLGSTAEVKYPAIYPFVPFQVEKIHSTVKNLAEDEDEEVVTNFFDIVDQKLSKAKSKVQPWTSTFWPLNKGLIADPYESSFVGYYVERGTFSWTANYNKFEKRKKTILAKIDELSSHQLKFLAPSEKYDLLMGDKSFDLTHRLWDYMQKWGNKKEYGFLSSIDISGDKTLEIARKLVEYGWFDNIEDAFINAYQLQGSLAPEYALELVKAGQYESVEAAMDEAIDLATEEAGNYVLSKKNQLIAFWEGICHGWATAAGVIARPRKTIQFTLPDKRILKFYPADIKALVSLLWANSLIQDNKYIDQETGKNIGGGVISAGLRCNLKNPKKDIWGRYYDSEPDPFNRDHSPRCVGVHPAIWHLGLVNIIGKQKRSFIVERKVDEAVDNHPMHGYTMKYFNPHDGNLYRDNKYNIVAIDHRDQFKAFRSPQAKYIVGVVTWMKYLDWKRPSRYFKDSEKNDKVVAKKMYYDLELDENYNIVGGQWRAKKIGLAADGDGLTHSQPDFFWIITKNWKPFFKEVPGLETWKDLSIAPPKTWKQSALIAHAFIYHKKYSYGTGQKCSVYNQKTGESRKVSCEFEVPKPQPLLNVVNKLIELAK